jgi:hypothetical protein
MPSQPIEEIRKQFHKEWLLIAVDEMDETTTTPMTGHLLFHDKNRDAIYDHLVQTTVALPLVTYSGDSPPQGYAFAF